MYEEARTKDKTTDSETQLLSSIRTWAGVPATVASAPAAEHHPAKDRSVVLAKAFGNGDGSFDPPQFLAGSSLGDVRLRVCERVCNDRMTWESFSMHGRSAIEVAPSETNGRGTGP